MDDEESINAQKEVSFNENLLLLDVLGQRLMHLSVSSPSGGVCGNFTVTYIPRVGILIGHHVPKVGNFGMVPILDNMENLEMSICYSSVMF